MDNEQKQEEKCKNCKYLADLKVFKRQIITIPRNSCIISGATIDVSNSSDNDSKCCTIFFKEANLIYETDLEDKCENFCPSINSNND